MDKNRIRQAATGRASGAATAEKRRILFYSVLIAVLAIALFRQQSGRRSVDTGTTIPSGWSDEPVVREPLATVDPSLLASVRDGTANERAFLEPQAKEHLVHQAGLLVWGDLQQMGLREATWTGLVNDSASFRGDPVFMIGTLAWLDSKSEAWPPEHRAEVLDQEGKSWNLLFGVEPEGLKAGDVVKVEGFFLKHHDMFRPDRTFSSGPLVIGEELRASFFRIDPVTELPEKELQGVRDVDLASASRPLDDPLLYKLLSYVQHTEVEELFPEEVPIEQFEMKASELLKNSPLYRGKPVRVFGRLLHIQRRPLGHRGENSLGTPFVYALWIDNQWGGMAVCLTMERPENFEGGDILDVDGVYYRRYAYENARSAVVHAAVVVSKRITKFVPVPSNTTYIILTVIVSLGLVVGALLFFGTMKDRRFAAAERQRRMGRHKRNIARPGQLHGDESPTESTSS
ncbi:MAG: hypothetical protein VX916_07300 [Planctomycetota bacterium]|nr:hypothetical protein [Planctomycetota bacterium]